MTLAKNVERLVPWNSTPLSITAQQMFYCDAIHGLTKTLWLDNGFGEHFIFTAARPYMYCVSIKYNLLTNNIIIIPKNVLAW